MVGSAAAAPVWNEAMQTSEFRKIVAASPFRPFRVRLGNGMTVDVRHRDFVLLSPSGQTAFIYTKVDPAGDEFEMVDVMLVEAVEFIRGNGGNGRGRRKPSSR